MANTSLELRRLAKETKKHVQKVDESHYALSLPTPLYERLQTISLQEGTSISDLIRRMIKMGLLMIDIEMEPGTEIIIRKPGKPEQRFFFLA